MYLKNTVLETNCTKLKVSFEKESLSVTLQDLYI